LNLKQVVCSQWIIFDLKDLFISLGEGAWMIPLRGVPYWITFLTISNCEDFTIDTLGCSETSALDISVGTDEVDSFSI
jgi:hypothetical protein